MPAGSVDALYVNALGRLTLCEFKLWRNPQARREVIGQILDYAKDLASWGYEDLQRHVSLALGGEGSKVLYKLVSKRHPDVVEAEFVDNVTRHLRRGEFLLLIVGDGIREGVEEIVDFIGRHSGLHFNLALVEAALYADGANHMIVQPPASSRPDDWRDVELWEGRSGRPRLGFRTQRDLSFLSGNEESAAYVGAVDWMRHRLNRLVSVVNPRIQEMLTDD